MVAIHPRSALVLMLACLLGASLVPLQAASEARSVVNLNPGWRFWLGEAPDQASAVDFDDRAWDVVSVPHTMELFPANLAGFAQHGRNLGWYRRVVDLPATWAGRKLFLEFRGAMQTTRLWVNGGYVGEYAVSGYDTFHFDITAKAKPGRNVITVRIDNTVNPDIPPDFRKTDFIQFGGLYRDVFLVATDPLHVTFPWEAPAAGVRLTLPTVSAEAATLKAETTLRNETGQPTLCTVVTEVHDRTGAVVSAVRSEQNVAAGADATVTQSCPTIARPMLWSPEKPYLYQVSTLVAVNGRPVDRIDTRYGIRWCEFTKDRGFLLNGQPYKLVGANRHQTWPYIGGAVPHSLHRLDAELLKASGFNWVRLSHYPHDPYFLDQLDELGLLALEEGPTWWGKGGSPWVANLERSFRSMIRRDRNHPCLMIWNCCVNHGGGEGFLVDAAKAEDPTRARGQDTVPCPMNFDHPKISGNGALTIEHTGHTFATRRGDAREYQLARRHWEMIDAAYRKPDNCGLAVWAMFDYNTFHNADEGIATHGVFDLFRLPKHTFWWHQAELTGTLAVHVLRVDDTTACVFSNGEQIRLSQNLGSGYQVVATSAPDAGTTLHHPPFHFTIDARAVALKAEALVAGAVKASGEWLKPGSAQALTVTTERSTLIADGSDLSRLVVTAVDGNGTVVDSATATITAAIQGPGQLIGENPVKLRAGRMILLVQGGYVPGTLTVAISGEGLRPTTQTLTTVRPSASVDLPSQLGAAQPTRSTRQVIPQSSTAAQAPWMTMEARKDAEAGQWVESAAILVPKESDQAAITIRGGEYRIYTGEWTAKPGKVQSGDAVYVRVKSRHLGPSWADDGKPDFAELTIGRDRARFDVWPKR